MAGMGGAGVIQWYQDYMKDVRIITGRWSCHKAKPAKIDLNSPELPLVKFESETTDINFKIAVSMQTLMDVDPENIAWIIYKAFKEYLVSIVHDCDACAGRMFDALEAELNTTIKPKVSKFSIGNKAAVTKDVSLSSASRALPGVMDYDVTCPAEGCDMDNAMFAYNIWTTVQHLNDHHRWTREAIAEWLENIHDPTGKNGPNLAFKIKEET